MWLNERNCSPRLFSLFHKVGSKGMKLPKFVMWRNKHTVKHLASVFYFSFFPLPKYVSVLRELQYVQWDATSQKGNIWTIFWAIPNYFKKYTSRVSYVWMYIFLSLIPIAYLLISVMTLPYGRTESGIQKCVCWSPTFKKLFLLDTWQIGKNSKKGHYCFFSAEKVLRLRSPPGLVF